MALDASRVQGTAKTDILAKLQSLFPAPAGLQAAEVTAYNAAQSKIAEACAEGEGAMVVEITGNAVVNTAVAVTSVSGVTPGGGASGPGAGTGTGTVA